MATPLMPFPEITLPYRSIVVAADGVVVGSQEEIDAVKGIAHSCLAGHVRTDQVASDKVLSRELVGDLDAVGVTGDQVAERRRPRLGIETRTE